MKLCIAYTIFDYELLERSMDNHKDVVDGIIVCFQRISNTGGKIAPPNLPNIIEYTPNLILGTKANEIWKHNLMIKTAKNQGYTHIVLAAHDHLYSKDQFNYAIEQVIKHDYDITYTKMFTYYKEPIYQLTPIEDYYMPFLIKLYPNTQVEKSAKSPVLVDPSVKINTIKKYHIFSEREVMLHHYSMVRSNIREKFKNAASSIRWKSEQVQQFILEYENFKLGEPLSYFQGRKTKEVPNQFNIEL